MHKSTTALGAALSLAVWMVAAAGQAPTIGESLFGLAPHQLARKPSVQRDLELSADQTAKVNSADRIVSRTMAAKRDPKSKPGDGFRTAAHLSAQMTEVVRQTLTEDQWARLSQIGLQLRIRNQGLLAPFSDASIQQRLKLTPNQLAAVQSWRDEQGATIRALRQGRNPNAVTPKLDEFHRRCNQALSDLLTEDQKAMWNGILGRPFEFTDADFGSRS